MRSAFLRVTALSLEEVVRRGRGRDCRVLGVGEHLKMDSHANPFCFLGGTEASTLDSVNVQIAGILIKMCRLW